MYRYFIYLAYDGTNYHGWQIQPNGNSVQEELMKALKTFLREDIEVVGAGRTDAGVHARLMVAHFDFHKSLDCKMVCEKMNKLLPHDISIYKVVPVREDAHSRFDATYRTYKYYITPYKNPFNRNYTWCFHQKLDVDKMNEAAATLFDYIDFTSFSKLHTDVKTNNCKIMHALWEKENGELVFTITADRFLRNMVRAIVGTLVDVGWGKLSIEGFRCIIENKDRSQAGSSVPGKGLFLVDIGYNDDIFLSC